MIIDRPVAGRIFDHMAKNFQILLDQMSPERRAKIASEVAELSAQLADAPDGANPDDIAPEYDFTDAVRNPYAKHFTPGSVLVTLDPDVAEHFPTAEAVNAALRSLITGK
jgi:hypothetical protein